MWLKLCGPALLKGWGVWCWGGWGAGGVTQHTKPPIPLSRIAPEGVVSRLGLTYHVPFCAGCKFAVSVSLKLLKAGLACKWDIALHVATGYFSAGWNGLLPLCKVQRNEWHNARNATVILGGNGHRHSMAKTQRMCVGRLAVLC